MRKKRGTLLVYILFVMLFVTVLLTAATFTMTNTAFLTKKMESQNLAYWAAISGLEYVNYNLKINENWPNGTSTSTVKFGSYKITETDNGSCITIKGVCGEPDTETYSEFCIVFSKAASPLSIVPSPKLPGVEYYSYNNSSEDETLKNVTVSNTGKKNEHTTTIANRGIYVTIDAKARMYRCVLEKLFQVAGNNGFDSAMYAGGDINIELMGEKSKFNIAQKTGERPSICTNGKFTLIRDKAYEGESSGCHLNDGTINYRTDCTIFDQEIMEEAGLRRRNGLLLNKMTDEPNIPRISWDSVTKGIARPEADSRDGFFKVVEGNNGVAAAAMKAGTYVLIKDSSEIKGYSMFRFDNGNGNHFINSKGERNDSILNKMTLDGYHKNFKDLGAEKVSFDKLLVKTDVFGIQVPVEGYEPVIDLDKDDAGNPILKLKGNVHITDYDNSSGLTLIALEKSGSKFKDLSSGTPQLYFSHTLSNYSNNDYVHEESDKREPKIESDPPPPSIRATLSSEGPIIIKGQLTGVGRLVSEGDISFETGSRVTNASSRPSDRIAIYSKSSVIMTTLSRPSPSATIALMKIALKNLRGKDIEELISNAIKKEFSYAIQKENKHQTLKAHLKDLGYSSAEIYGMVSGAVNLNAEVIFSPSISDNKFRIVQEMYIKDNPNLPISPPSCFRGVIYACDNFIAKSADENVGVSFTLNGVLVAYGGDPSNDAKFPGDNKEGHIYIDNCIDFNILYDPKDLEYITKNMSQGKAVKLYELMFNKII